MSEKKIKNFCYKLDCGPIVKTGFNIEQYWVCKNCKEEITERLKQFIEDCTPGVPLERDTDDDDDGSFWGI